MGFLLILHGSGKCVRINKLVLKINLVNVEGSSVKTHFFFNFFDLLKFRVKFGVLFDFNGKIWDFGGFFMGGE